MVDLITADYLRRVRENRSDVDTETAKERIRRLVELCMQNRRNKEGVLERGFPFRADAALLVRFLAEKGGEDA